MLRLALRLLYLIVSVSTGLQTDRGSGWDPLGLQTDGGGNWDPLG